MGVRPLGGIPGGPSNQAWLKEFAVPWGGGPLRVHLGRDPGVESGPRPTFRGLASRPCKHVLGPLGGIPGGMGAPLREVPVEPRGGYPGVEFWAPPPSLPSNQACWKSLQSPPGECSREPPGGTLVSGTPVPWGGPAPSGGPLCPLRVPREGPRSGVRSPPTFLPSVQVLRPKSECSRSPGGDPRGDGGTPPASAGRAPWGLPWCRVLGPAPLPA